MNDINEILYIYFCEIINKQLINRIQNDIFKFSYNAMIYRSALHLAVEKENLELVQMLLSNPKIDVNIIAISIYSVKFHFYLFI